MFVTVVLRLAAIFLMIGAGWVARKTRLVDDASTASLARLLTSLFYPALIFSAITGQFTVDSLRANWQLPVGAFGIMLTGFLVGFAVERLFTDPHSPRGHSFLFQCTINNYSFLPLPFALLFWGEKGVAMLVLSTLGSEVAVWTLGAYSLSGRRLHPSALLRLIKPPLVAIAIAILVIFLRDTTEVLTPLLRPRAIVGQFVSSVAFMLGMFGGATIPVAMIVAGARMAELKPGHIADRLQVAVVVLRLIAIPALTIAALSVLPIEPQTRDVLILVAAMPSAIAGVVLSELFGADKSFAATSVLVTHIGSLVTIPFWLTVAL